MFRTSWFIGLFWCWGIIITAHSQQTPYRLPQVYAIQNAKIHPVTQKAIEKGTLVVRNGVIVELGEAEKVKIPADATVIDGTGLNVYPGLIDSYTSFGMPAQSNDPAYAAYERGNVYANARVRPERRAGDLFQADAAALAARRRQGFTAALVVPPSGIFSGQSALISLGEGEARDLMIQPALYVHLNLRDRSRPFSEEGGGGGYPSSLMGTIALIRQVFYDTQHQLEVQRLYNSSPKNKPRPPLNKACSALEPVIKGQIPLVVYTTDAQDILRVIRLADEFNLKIIIAGGAEAARVADLLAKRKIPVLLNMEMSEMPRTYDPLSPPTLTSLRNRALAAQNAALLHKAGVEFVFATDGLEPSRLLTNIRTAIENGLPKEVALECLTIRPAKLFGVDNQIGSIEAGKTANLTIVEGDLFDSRGRVRSVFVDGRETKADAAPVAAGPPTEFRRRPPRHWDAEQTSANELSTSCCLMGGAFHHHEHDGLTAGLFPSNQPPVEEGAPEQPRQEGEREQGAQSGEGQPRALKPVSLEPFAPPPADEHNTWLVKNATVWTLTAQGKLENTDVLVVNGTIRAVGKNLQVPANARTIDATGKHLIPGIIDCHSHTAISGGVNEGTNVCTAEVRIEDVINAYDVNIYRQLAGGTTGANLLHGSANVIGGQNAVIKFRWGKQADGLLFKEAPKGIKFALGENVKRSNFGGFGGGGNVRYPASRMGVEQTVRERFIAALDYKRQQEEFKAGKRPYPPARDLQLDAMLEILEGKRLIHCHSYRQDEILMLIRLCEEFGVKIATFQHVLEGYKVADEMAKHGAGGSTFSDWWAFKIEAYDAIPYNGALMTQRGVVVSFNSDSSELARRLNLEAAKAVKYGGLTDEEALKLVTLNPAKQLGIDQYVGTIEPGKHADFSLWTGHPLHTYSVCEKTFVDGVLYFDRQRDAEWREKLEQEKQDYLKEMRSSSFFDTSGSERAAGERGRPGGTPPPVGETKLEGVWKGKITGGDPIPPEGFAFTLTITKSGSAYSGTLETEMGTVTISSITFDAGTGSASFNFTVPGAGAASVSATVRGSQLNGTLSIFGQSFNLQAERIGGNDGSEAHSETQISNFGLKGGPMEKGSPPLKGDEWLLAAHSPHSASPSLAIINAVIHPLTAPVIERGTVIIQDGKIVAVGADLQVPEGATVYDADGLHLYPGLIDSNTTLGLTEIESIQATVDTSETGQFNPNARVEIAINPDSELIPVARANGITTAVVAPSGGIIAGMGCVIDLDGWTWEEMCIASPLGMYLNMPAPGGDTNRPGEQRRQEWQNQLRPLKEFLENARRYKRARDAGGKEGLPIHERDVRYEAMIPVLQGEVPLFVRANNAIAIRAAIEWAEQEKLRIIIVGGSEAWKVASILKEKKVPVILGRIHSLPPSEDAPYDLPFRHVKQLSEAGVLFAFSSSDASNVRNLPYHAATAVAFGLPQSEAMKALTLYPARILGMEKQLGSIETGKQANLILTTGDPLQIRTQVKQVFIKGKPVEMGNKHTRLYEKYRSRPKKEAESAR